MAQLSLVHYFPEILHCLRNPCKYGGTCIEDNPGWHCECIDGFAGKDCSIGKYFPF